MFDEPKCAIPVLIKSLMLDLSVFLCHNPEQIINLKHKLYKTLRSCKVRFNTKNP